MLDSKEYKVLNAIDDYISSNGYSPSVRELCVLVGFSSTNTIYLYLKRLERLGYIERIKNFPRTIKIIKKTEKGSV